MSGSNRLDAVPIGARGDQWTRTPIGHAAAADDAATARGRGRRRPSTPARPVRRGNGMSTPARVRLLASAVGLLVTVLAVVLIVEVRDERDGFAAIGHRTAPLVVASTDLYFALNDMDAQLANMLLVGDDEHLGFTRAQASAIYEQRRVQVSEDLQQAAAASTDPATARLVRDILDALGRYEALAAQTMLLDEQVSHPAGQPSAGALARYRQATDLLKSSLLPPAQELSDRNARLLEGAYQAQQARTLRMRIWIVLAGLAALGALLSLQVFYARRFRRLLNPALLAAFLLTVALAAGGVMLCTGAAEHLRSAKKDAFDSVLVLNRARAVSYDANADESRYLLDPDRAARYEEAFLAKSQQLLDLEGATLATYDQRLDLALQGYRADRNDVGWRGLFGTAFRNITFAGERAAAEATVQRYQTYQRDDRRIRDLVRTGHLRDAVALCTSYEPGGSNHAFNEYDTALAALIDINQRAFDQRIGQGEENLTWWTFVPSGTALAVIVLLVVGLRRRLAEYS